METELIKLGVQLGMGGIFFYLFWRADQRLQEQGDKHDKEMAALYNLRINDLKLFARLPTDLDGSYAMPSERKTA